MNFVSLSFLICKITRRRGTSQLLYIYIRYIPTKTGPNHTPPKCHLNWWCRVIFANKNARNIRMACLVHHSWWMQWDLGKNNVEGDHYVAKTALLASVIVFPIICNCYHRQVIQALFDKSCGHRPTAAAVVALLLMGCRINSQGLSLVATARPVSPNSLSDTAFRPHRRELKAAASHRRRPARSWRMALLFESSAQDLTGADPQHGIWLKLARPHPPHRRSRVRRPSGRGRSQAGARSSTPGGRGVVQPGRREMRRLRALRPRPSEEETRSRRLVERRWGVGR